MGYNPGVAYQRGNYGLQTLVAERIAKWGKPARYSEYVTGYKSATNVSGHCPDSNGIVHGVDIFVGPGNLPYAAAVEMFDAVRREGVRGNIDGHPKRCRYIIYNRAISGDFNAWSVSPYTGADPHTDHLHISTHDQLWGDNVGLNPDDYDSTLTWSLSVAGGLSTDKPQTILEDDMANVPQAEWNEMKVQMKSLVDNVATKSTITQQTKDLPAKIWGYTNPALGGPDAYQILRDALASDKKLSEEVAKLAAKAASGGANEAQIRQAVMDGLSAGVNVDVTVGSTPKPENKE